MKSKDLVFILFLISNFVLGQTFPDSQNPNRIENQVTGKKERKIKAEQRLIKIVQSDAKYGELLLAREQVQKSRVEAKVQALNSQLKDLKNTIATLKKDQTGTEKRVKKLYRSVIKVTKRINKEQQKLFALKERIGIIEKAILQATKKDAQ